MATNSDSDKMEMGKDPMEFPRTPSEVPPANMYTSPVTHKDLKRNDDDMDLDENAADTSITSISTEKGLGLSSSSQKPHLTPEAIRTRRQVQEELHMSSPSDSLLSPCTAKLFGRGGRKAVSGPAAALRKKQMTSIPFNINNE